MAETNSTGPKNLLLWAQFVKQYSKAHDLTYSQGLAQAGPAWTTYKVSVGKAPGASRSTKQREKRKQKQKDEGRIVGDDDASGSESESESESEVASPPPPPKKHRRKSSTPVKTKVHQMNGRGEVFDKYGRRMPSHSFFSDDEYDEEITTVRRKRKRDDIPHRLVAQEKKKRKRSKEPKEQGPPPVFSKEVNDMIAKNPPSKTPKKKVQVEGVGSSTNEGEDGAVSSSSEEERVQEPGRFNVAGNY